MVKKINGRLAFCYACPIKIKRKTNRRFYISLSMIIVGIFLLPNIAYFTDITSENLIDLTNQERVKAGLNVVTANQLLAKAAYNKGQAILTSQTFKHNLDGQKFSSWIKDAGYQYSYVGENLAVDFVTAEGIISTWLDSPTHRKNLLEPQFSEIGIATVEGMFQGQNTIIVVQILGSPPQAIAYPMVMGINDYNLQIDQTNWLNMHPISQENLLTHSLVNQPLLSATFNKLTIKSQITKLQTKPNQLSKLLNNNYFSVTFNYIIMTISIISILSLCYLYFFFFSRLTKLSH